MVGAGQTGMAVVRGPVHFIEQSGLLFVVRARLARDGFQRTLEWATTVPEPRDDADRSVQVTVEAGRATAERVFRWHLLPNKCLEQSLVVARFLARRRIKVDVLIAVRKYPFESHAWARWKTLDLTTPPAGDPDHFRLLKAF